LQDIAAAGEKQRNEKSEAERQKLGAEREMFEKGRFKKPITTEIHKKRE